MPQHRHCTDQNDPNPTFGRTPSCKQQGLQQLIPASAPMRQVASRAFPVIENLTVLSPKLGTMDLVVSRIVEDVVDTAVQAPVEHVLLIARSRRIQGRRVTSRIRCPKLSVLADESNSPYVTLDDSAVLMPAVHGGKVFRTVRELVARYVIVPAPRMRVVSAPLA